MWSFRFFLIFETHQDTWYNKLEWWCAEAIPGVKKERFDEAMNVRSVHSDLGSLSCDQFDRANIPEW